jgi:hypothetical protein
MRLEMRSGFHQGQKPTCFNKRPDICMQLSFVARTNSILAKRGGPYMSPEFLSDDHEKLDVLFSLIAQQRVGKQPGRIEPRAIKRRPKPFPLLTKPRQIAREEIRKYGHPKKLN